MLLTPTPGISYFSALLIIAEISASRFPPPKNLASLAKLVPSVHSSGGKTRHAPISEQGSKWLRWILIELYHHFPNTSPKLNPIFHTASSKHGVHKKPESPSPAKCSQSSSICSEREKPFIALNPDGNLFFIQGRRIYPRDHGLPSKR